MARALRLVGIAVDGPAEGQTLSELVTALGISKSSTAALARTRGGRCFRADRARPAVHARHRADPARARSRAASSRSVTCAARCWKSCPATPDDAHSRWPRQLPRLHRRRGRPGSVRFYTARPRGGAVRSAAGATRTMTDRRSGAGLRGDPDGAAHRARHHRRARTPLDNLAAARRNGFAVDDEEDAEGRSARGGVLRARAGAISVTGIRPTGRAAIGGPCAATPTKIGPCSAGRAHGARGREPDAHATELPGTRPPRPRSPRPRLRSPASPEAARPGPRRPRASRGRLLCGLRPPPGGVAGAAGPPVTGPGEVLIRAAPSGCAAPTWISWPAGSPRPLPPGPWRRAGSGDGARGRMPPAARAPAWWPRASCPPATARRLPGGSDQPV